SEDVDLCRRIRSAGFRIGFEPSAEAIHIGGVSAPRPQLLAVLAASRIRYATKHRGRLASVVERIGVALGELTHSIVARSSAHRRGHLRALRIALSFSDPPCPENGASSPLSSTRLPGEAS